MHWGGFYPDRCCAALGGCWRGPAPRANGGSVFFPLLQATYWEKRGAWPSPRGHPSSWGGTGTEGPCSEPAQVTQADPGVGLLARCHPAGGAGDEGGRRMMQVGTLQGGGRGHWGV